MRSKALIGIVSAVALVAAWRGFPIARRRAETRDSDFESPEREDLRIEHDEEGSSGGNRIQDPRHGLRRELARQRDRRAIGGLLRRVGIPDQHDAIPDLEERRIPDAHVPRLTDLPQIRYTGTPASSTV